MATVYTPRDAVKTPKPRRAVGVAHVAVDVAPRTFKLDIAAPQVQRPNSKMTVNITASGPNDNGYVQLAAVDEGILLLTGFKTPDPAEYFFGKRRLGVELRDDYGRLLDPNQGAAGNIRQGGDQIGGAGLTVVPTQVGGADVGAGEAEWRQGDGHARCSGVQRRAAADGGGLVQLGRRLGVEAGDGARSGSGPAGPAALPRAGRHRHGDADARQRRRPGGRLQRRAAGNGAPVRATTGQLSANLAEGPAHRSRRAASRLAAEGISTVCVQPDGSGQLCRLAHLSDPDAFGLAAGEQCDPDDDPAGGDVLACGELAVVVRAGLGLCAGVVLAHSDGRGGAVRLARPVSVWLHRADHQPCAAAALCHRRSRRWRDARRRPTCSNQVQEAVNTLLNRQGADGAIGLWRTGDGLSSPWLGAYATDFLFRAKAAGYVVPDAALDKAYDALEEFAVRGSRVTRRAMTSKSMRAAGTTTPRKQMMDRSVAYAAYVLAKARRMDKARLRYLHDDKLKEIASPLARAQIGAALYMIGDNARAKSAFEQAEQALGYTEHRRLLPDAAS